MDYYSMQILYNGAIREVLNFYHSPVFSFIKFAIGIYVIILLVNIVLLIIQRGVGANLRQMRFGMDIPHEFVSQKDKMRMRWENIKKRLDSPNESEYKVAIIEADNIIDDLIKRMGYKGANMGERLANVPEGQLYEVKEIKAAHETRNRIIHEEDFKVDKEFARKTLKQYEHLLHHFEVLD